MAGSERVCKCFRIESIPTMKWGTCHGGSGTGEQKAALDRRRYAEKLYCVVAEQKIKH